MTKDIAIEVTAVFGGVELIVPRNAKVIVQNTSFFGGVDNKMRFGNPNAEHTLMLKCSAVFGGIDIL